MRDEASLALTLFVEHGREQEAADFYAAAFAAEQVETLRLDDGVLMAVEMLIGATTIAVAGSNPRRETDPSYGGPFFPKAPGAVSTVIRLTVADLRRVVETAVAAGATLRDPVQADQAGRMVASVFDPFGHIWALVERDAASQRLVA